MSEPEITVESLLCNGCGAPLSVPASANFVTCNHCQTQLAVRRTSSASYTETLQQVARQTEALTEQVKYLAYQNELAALDQAWERERESHLITDNNGRRHEPTEFGAILAFVICGVFGLFAMTIGISAAGGMAALFGVAFIGIGVVVGLYQMSRARSYRAAHERYLRLRASLSPDNVDIHRFTARGQGEDSAQQFLADLE
jgi:LSD1 subclass zinc finger protein